MGREAMNATENPTEAPAESEPAIPVAGYTQAEFCAARKFSRALYFKMKKRGLGPREMKVGKRRIITPQAAADWDRERENADA